MYLALQTENIVSALAHDLVPQMAPYEIMLFQHQRELYLSNPEKVLRSVWDGCDEILFLTPILIAVLNDIVSYLCQEFRQILEVDNGDEVNCAVRHVFRTFTKEENTPKEVIKLHITEIQRATIRRLALSRALSYRLSTLKARQLADMIVANLVSST